MFMFSLYMSREVFISDGFVVAQSTLMPFGVNVMFMRLMCFELMRSFSLKFADSAWKPLDIDTMPGCEVCIKVLFCFALERAMITLKGCAWPATWWQHYGHVRGRKGR